MYGEKKVDSNLHSKQDKYTMDPGRQIYLSNNKQFLVNNDFLTTKSKTIPEKHLGKQNLRKSFFEKKN